MDYQAILKTPFGALGIRHSDDALTGIGFMAPNTKPQAPCNAFARNVCEQLTAYFADPDFRFDLPLRPGGTIHQNKVWRAMCAIPCGQVRTYGELAIQIGSAPRAVGQACGNNPIPIIIPCHRVVSKSGMGGFMHHSVGYALDIKRWLLAHEVISPSPSTGEGWGEGEGVEPPPLLQPLSDETTSHSTRRQSRQVVGYRKG